MKYKDVKMNLKDIATIMYQNLNLWLCKWNIIITIMICNKEYSTVNLNHRYQFQDIFKLFGKMRAQTDEQTNAIINIFQF